MHVVNFKYSTVSKMQACLFHFKLLVPCCRVVLCSFPDWIVVGKCEEEYLYSSYYGPTGEDASHVQEDIQTLRDLA